MSQHPPDPLLVLNHFKLSVLFMLFHVFGLSTGFPLTYIAFPFSLLILLLSSHEPFWRRQWQPTPVLLPGKSHGQRSLVGCSPWGRWESDTTEWLHFHFSFSCIGEDSNPLQCSCLENPRDGGAWWAAIYGVAQSQTQLKRLSSMELLFFSSFPFCWFVSYIFVCFFLPVIPKCCKCTYCGISKKFMLCLFIANPGLFIFCINIPGFI